MVEAVTDRDGKLSSLLQTCPDCNPKPNKEKISLRSTDVQFVGQRMTKDGLKPDPDKVHAVREMTLPTDSAVEFEVI